MSSGELIEIEESPVKTTINSFELENVNLSIVISKFSNKLQIIITETGKTGVLYEVSKVKGPQNNPKSIHDVNCLLGVETETTLIAARILGQEISSEIPLIIGFGLSDPEKLEPSTIKKLVEFIQKCL